MTLKACEIFFSLSISSCKGDLRKILVVGIIVLKLMAVTRSKLRKWLTKEDWAHVTHMPGSGKITHMYIVCACSVARVCQTLYDPLDYSPPGSTIRGIFQARILEWFAISSSRGSCRPRDGTLISCTGRGTLHLLSPGVGGLLQRYPVTKEKRF